MLATLEKRTDFSLKAAVTKQKQKEQPAPQQYQLKVLSSR